MHFALRWALPCRCGGAFITSRGARSWSHAPSGRTSGTTREPSQHSCEENQVARQPNASPIARRHGVARLSVAPLVITCPRGRASGTRPERREPKRCDHSSSRDPASADEIDREKNRGFPPSRDRFAVTCGTYVRGTNVHSSEIARSAQFSHGLTQEIIWEIAGFARPRSYGAW